MGARENKVEKYLDDQVKKLGGITRKWVSPGRSGVPDRIVIVDGEVVFVEVKTTDGKMSARQIRECQQLNDAEVQTSVVYGHIGVDEFIGYLRTRNSRHDTAGLCAYGSYSDAEEKRLRNAGFLV